MTTAHDAVYDCCLTGLGYIPYLLNYRIVDVAKTKKSDALYNFYANMKTLPLPDNMTWETFLPYGTPVDNWEDWEEAALRFLASPDEYVSSLLSIYPPISNWENANKDSVDQLGIWHKEVATKLDLCPTYDQVWPKVMWNYRSMSGVNGEVDEMTVKVMKNKDTSQPEHYAIVKSRLKNGSASMIHNIEAVINKNHVPKGGKIIPNVTRRKK